ncbi:MAG TPA: nucleotide exchange factor GrpE [Candidatus Paceibacterota bacterium]|nr:nucleotide exchange factor GrpE [Candidatus Paceibacterota bacterium]
MEEIQNKTTNGEVQDNHDAWEQKAQEYLNGWKRAQADLINYKKEEAKRVADVIKFGNETVILQVIDLYDDLQRALSHAPPEINEKHSLWLKGMQQVARRFDELLKNYGVEKIDTANMSFDPDVHEAVHKDVEHEAEGEKIIEEYRPGYRMNGKVIRPARVKISK